MCLAQGPQRSDVGDAQTLTPQSSQALYHWATALPPSDLNETKQIRQIYIPR